MTERQPTASFPIHPPSGSQAAESTPLSVGLTPTGSPGDTPQPDDVLPRPFGRYELRRLLGRGGMGRVYLAHDPKLDRLVALKMPTTVAVDGWRERFFSEARAAATLTHPNVCAIYEMGEEEGQPYLTMAYIEGETLATRLVRDGRMTPAAAVTLVHTVAQAMHEAHKRGIVHRDLKPANLMIDPSGRPVIMDFGLAIRSTATDDLRITLTGVALGTPSYMPPEQAGGDNDAIGPPADVYALGVILYELVTGRVPFKAKSFGKLLAQIERDAPKPPSAFNPDVDPALEAVILKCLAKRAADRFDTAGDLANALERYLEGDRAGLISLYSRPYLLPEPTTGDFRHVPSAQTTVEHRKPSHRAWWLAGAAALFLAVGVAAGIIYVQTDYGDLKVELSDPDAKVEVRVNGQTVTLTADGKVTHIKAGPGELVVTGDDFETTARSFNLKRNGIETVKVTLIPKRPGPGIPPKKGSVGEPDLAVIAEAVAQAGAGAATSAVAARPKPVPFPDKSTLVEAGGWQILTNATKKEMQEWLAEREKGKHSVMWLDMIQVGDKPLFSAVAALDEREPGWRAFLDVECPKGEKINVPFERLFDVKEYWPRSISSTGRGQASYTTALWWPGVKGVIYGNGVDPVELNNVLETNLKNGLTLRVLRPYTGDQGVVAYALCIQRTPGQTTTHEVEMTANKLTEFLEEERRKGHRPISLAATPQDGKLLFSAVMADDPNKTAWEVDTDATAQTLQTRAKAQLARGFVPTIATAYPWDGAVRYCVVWVKEPPKPTPYPKGPTLVDVAGWQILTDATKEQADQWLKEKKDKKQSVVYLDVTQVAGKPLYAAVAALDDRQASWVVTPDIDVAHPDAMKKVAEVVDPARFAPAALSGYSVKDAIRATLLWHPAPPHWQMPAPVPDVGIEPTVEAVAKRGFSPYAIRQFPFGGADRRAFLLFDYAGTAKREYHTPLAAAKLAEVLAAQRKAGLRPIHLSACPRGDLIEFSLVAQTNTEKAEWEADADLTSAQLKSKAEERAKKGLRPSCVTAYPFDGAVRYCVVWVKEPPKPTPYPKGPTLVEAAGWQMLTDATKDQMQKWLDERKEKKHSVVWLDAYEVAGKPVFCAAAVLDDRQPDWKVLWDVPAGSVKDNEAMKKYIDQQAWHPVSLSGYVADGQIVSVSLWRAGKRLWGIHGDAVIEKLDEALDNAAKMGYGVKVLRAYSIGGKAVAWAYCVERRANAANGGELELTPDKLNAALERLRKEDKMPVSLAGYVVDGSPLFALAAEPRPAKVEWDVGVSLPAAQLKGKAAEFAKKGLRPSCVTAYPFDGAVRYCVVWVKEPPKPIAPPKEKTLIELPGWQILTDATKGEMETWLAERKKAKHSVLWLDCTPVGDKQVFCAVAALDDREPGWTAMLDVPLKDMPPVAMRKRIDTEANKVRSLSGYWVGDELMTVILWQPGAKRWLYSALDYPTEDFKAIIEKNAKAGTSVICLRPLPTGEDGLRWGHYGQVRIGNATRSAVGLSEEKLTEYLGAQRKDGYHPISLAAANVAGERVFGVIVEKTPAGVQWHAEWGLSASKLAETAKTRVANGFHPDVLTAYPFDGAVRYCVVWVKESKKP